MPPSSVRMRGRPNPRAMKRPRPSRQLSCPHCWRKAVSSSTALSPQVSTTKMRVQLMVLDWAPGRAKRRERARSDAGHSDAFSPFRYNLMVKIESWYRSLSAFDVISSKVSLTVTWKAQCHGLLSVSYTHWPRNSGDLFDVLSKPLKCQFFAKSSGVDWLLNLFFTKRNSKILRKQKYFVGARMCC